MTPLLRLAVALVLAAAPALAGPASAQEAAEGPAGDLRERLEELVGRHHGTAGVAVIDLASGVTVSVRGDERFPTASTVKVPVLVEVYRRVEEGDLRLRDPIYLLEADKRPGSGILQDLDAPHELTVHDAAYLMITLSDNTATNLLIRKVGIRAVNEGMTALGLRRTRLHHEVFDRERTSVDPGASEEWGLGVTTPVELGRLFEWMYRGELVSEEASEGMLDLLRSQHHDSGIPRRLPGGVDVAHKTGSVSRSRSDCGIVYGAGEGSRDFVLCVMTKENEDTSWRITNEAEVLAGDVARLAYDHFSGRS